MPSSASPIYLETIFCFGSSNYSSFGACRKSNICISQKRRTKEPRKQQDERRMIGNRRLAARKDMLTPSSLVSPEVSPPPLVSALKVSAEQNVASFHFPGHNRGRAAPSSLTQLIGTRPFLHDLPELPELDNLFSPEGSILEAQALASKLFGASETWFLVGGTTCGIQAAIMATCSPGDSLILPRNSHISAMSAMVLSGALPKFISPQYNFDWDIASGVTLLQVEKAIKELEKEGQKAAAVFVTSPTYHGVCSDLSRISQVCHSHGIPLIVDEAHGAHLGFHPSLPKSALQQGADLAVQSTHKVLCSLTQSSMLHMSGNIVDRERICRCLQMLQSTSPSYLLLASLDAARAQISDRPAIIFDKAIKLAVEAKNAIEDIPCISVLDNLSFSDFPVIDPLRLTIGVWQLSLSGYKADEILDRDHGVISELVGTQSITFAVNLGTCRDHLQRLVLGINCLSASSIPAKGVEERMEASQYVLFADVSMSLSPREAFFASKRRVNIRESLGEICGELICPYPPGIPVLMPGEVITERGLDYLLQVRSKGALISGASDSLLSSIVVCNV
ncbi:uncharacterized protein LOC131166044 [Malania oleifera]|uniref:uncharacterized protein LOC131166044 n=1 Tax=Malania oleifera TaxID=397392 RepID=UPI0025AEB4AB|nr:uncharacterized protein LOC131166044 [Malania oleifera]